MTDEEERLLRDHAAGKVTWKDLRRDGWLYWDVLEGLGKLKLRPFVASGGGPNTEALAEGRRLLDEALVMARGS